MAIRESKIQFGKTIFNRQVELLLYTDDVIIAGSVHSQ